MKFRYKLYKNLQYIEHSAIYNISECEVVIDVLIWYIIWASFMSIKIASLKYRKVHMKPNKYA